MVGHTQNNGLNKLLQQSIKLQTEWCAAADQEAKAQAQVEVSLQEAVDILTAATKGCGSYAKPILRHITTVADFAKKEGIQVHITLNLSQYVVILVQVSWVRPAQLAWVACFSSLQNHT